MRLLWPRLTAEDLALGGAGALATVFAAAVAVRVGAEVSVGLLAGVAAFLGAVVAFIARPHLAVAGSILLFPLVPALKVLVASEIGAIKDIVVIAAVLAALIVYGFDRRPVDRIVLLLVAVLLGMYVINVGSGHSIAWAQGVRLIAEPLLLLLVGLILSEPRRTLKYALGALIITALVVGGYGVFQQVVGKYTLVDWGYSFEAQVRSLGNGRLRSFGSLDDPFAYAAFLLFGLAAVFFWLRRGVLAWTVGGFLLFALGFSFVRTAVLVLIAFLGLALQRRGFTVSAVLAVAATVIAGIVILVNAGGSQERSVSVTSGAAGAGGSANLVLNGRISAWQAALGDNPGQWLLGRGVGQIGTAAARASYDLAPPSTTGDQPPAQAVDSGYLATIADVGLVGLVVLLALFGRLLSLAGAAARRGLYAGWVALGLLAVLLVDALTRASFTGFPTAFLGLLLIGIALAAAAEESSSGTAPMAATGR